MTPLAFQQRSCHMKHRYFDQISARIVAEKRLAKGAPALKPYLCEFCQGWHLTKKIDNHKQGA